jgi:hypothetical protein
MNTNSWPTEDQFIMRVNKSLLENAPAAQRFGIQLPRALGNASQKATISRAKRSAAMQGWALAFTDKGDLGFCDAMFRDNSHRGNFD